MFFFVSLYCAVCLIIFERREKEGEGGRARERGKGRREEGREERGWERDEMGRG